MKKKLIVLSAILLLMIALSVTALAATKKATLINADGDKVVVAVGSSEAIYYLDTLDYKLMTSDGTLGAVSGPSSMSNTFTFNGVTHWYASSGLITASSTICALKSPIASSTLIFGSIRFNTSTTTATFIEIAKTGTTAYATTTLLGRYSLTANQKTVIYASTTPSYNGLYDDVASFAANQYFVARMQGGVTSKSGNAPKGKCIAEWIEN